MKQNMAQLERLRFIDFLLDRFGVVNRSDIADYFGLSIPQATLDLTAYQAVAPNNAEYNKSRRCYQASKTYQRIYR